LSVFLRFFVRRSSRRQWQERQQQQERRRVQDRSLEKERDTDTSLSRSRMSISSMSFRSILSDPKSMNVNIKSSNRYRLRNNVLPQLQWQLHWVAAASFKSPRALNA
jgi:hypothetical protein